MDWTATNVVIGLAIALIGWILPSPITMQSRIGKIETDLAVLVTTVNTLRETVTDLVRLQRGNGNNNDSGQRTRVR
jgi:hypothetical protein